ncbi:hypothetical protein J6590_041427 [Homalodisca vitripennis]|nr:hypothetical protein J6590_041427 [Homalodisca vitripennis]
MVIEQSLFGIPADKRALGLEPRKRDQQAQAEDGAVKFMAASSLTSRSLRSYMNYGQWHTGHRVGSA